MKVAILIVQVCRKKTEIYLASAGRKKFCKLRMRSIAFKGHLGAFMCNVCKNLVFKSIWYRNVYQKRAKSLKHLPRHDHQPKIAYLAPFHHHYEIVEKRPVVYFVDIKCFVWWTFMVNRASDRLKRFLCLHLTLHRRCYNIWRILDHKRCECVY